MWVESKPTTNVKQNLVKKMLTKTRNNKLRWPMNIRKSKTRGKVKQKPEADNWASGHVASFTLVAQLSLWTT